MKNHRLIICSDKTVETYNKITNILGWTPFENERDKRSDYRYSVWSYEVETSDNDPYFDFINVFLDRLEPKFIDLEKLGIKKEDITIWLLYEYDQQCGLELSPSNMKRLGNNEISLCIDCWQNSAK
jgi:hypothetical protein